jgi:hypothetical protein
MSAGKYAKLVASMISKASITMMVWEPLEVQRDRPVAQHTDLNVHSLSEMLSEPDRRREGLGATSADQY